jgi:hypothetical protein
MGSNELLWHFREIYDLEVRKFQEGLPYESASDDIFIIRPVPYFHVHGNAILLE